MRTNFWVLVAIIMLSVMPAGVQAQSDDGLVAEWHFDEGFGSVLKDSSGNGNDGVIYGATWVEGKYGKALSFDGVDDYVEVPDSSSLDISDGITIEVWVKPVSTPSKYYNIISKGDPPLHSKQAPWQLTTNNKLRVFRLKNDNSEGEYDICDLPLNVWTMIIVTFDRSIGKVKVHKNGKFVKEWDKINSIYNDDVEVTIGAQTWNAVIYPDSKFNGIIDEVCIYNRALTEEEIKEHYEQGPTALSVIKTVSPQSIKQGQTTTITLTIKNTGSTEIKDIEIADTIPQDLTFIDGETLKSYASLSPKDSRQFQYVVQLDEAGTYNLDPATATYADENGNYHTIKSKPVAIEVIPSLIETDSKRPAGGDAQTASVHLHGEKTDVVMGEDILLKLAAVNLITKPTMHVQVIITPPSGMSVTSSEFVQSGAGLFTASYEIEPGVGRDIEVRMRSNQVGDFVVNGRIVYYFGDDMDDAEDHTLTLPIKVRVEAEQGAERTESSSESKGSSAPGFGSTFAAAGVFLVTLLIKRRRLR